MERHGGDQDALALVDSGHLIVRALADVSGRMGIFFWESGNRKPNRPLTTTTTEFPIPQIPKRLNLSLGICFGEFRESGRGRRGEVRSGSRVRAPRQGLEASRASELALTHKSASTVRGSCAHGGARGRVIAIVLSGPNWQM